MAAGIEEQFDASVRLVKALPKEGSMQPSYADLAKMYAYYKQAEFGECQIPKPGFWDFVGQRKWEAWSSIKGMSKEEAMENYVTYIKEMFEKFQESDEYREKQQDYSHVVDPFCKAIGKKNVTEKESNKANQEKIERHGILKVNGTFAKHRSGNNECSRMNGDNSTEKSDSDNVHEQQKPSVKINGVCEMNYHEDEHASLSHSIIENILRSGEESLKSTYDETVRDSNVMAQSDFEAGYIYLDNSKHKASGNREETDDSDNEVYCDSLWELPDTSNDPVSKADSCAPREQTYVENGCIPMAVQPSDEEGKRSRDSRLSENANISGNITAAEGICKQQSIVDESENNAHTDLSSLSSGSMYEHIAPVDSLQSMDEETPLMMGADQFGVNGDDLSFLNDSKGPGLHNQHGQKGAKRKRCGKHHHGHKTDSSNSDDPEHITRNRPSSTPVAPRVIASSQGHASKGASHGNDPNSGGTNGSRRNQDSNRSHPDHAERSGRAAGRSEGQDRAVENCPYRRRETSSSSDSDGSAAETIGEKILHCLQRLQEDVQGIKDRLSSIEQSIKDAAVTPTPWWYKYLPSKTVACLILWPLLLNLMFLYMRRRKRK